MMSALWIPASAKRTSGITIGTTMTTERMSVHRAGKRQSPPKSRCRIDISVNPSKFRSIVASGGRLNTKTRAPARRPRQAVGKLLRAAAHDEPGDPGPGKDAREKHSRIDDHLHSPPS